MAVICIAQKTILDKISKQISIQQQIVFFLNYMILHSEKCHYMCIGRNCADDAFLHNGKKFKNSKEETILGVIIDNKLSFDSHIKRICKKAGLSGSLHFHEYQLSLI